MAGRSLSGHPKRMVPFAISGATPYNPTSAHGGSLW
jgi:hypothetical protein